jgi:hypothetical protein
MFRTLLGVIVVVALLSGVLVGTDVVEAQTPSTVTMCGGNPVKQVALRTQTEPTLLPAGEEVELNQGVMEIKYNAGAGGDMFVVSFSAECLLLEPSSGPNDFVGVYVTLNDEILPPGRIQFCSADRPATYSATFCKEGTQGGFHSVRVYAQVVNGDTPGLTGALGKWTLMLQVTE